MPFDEHHENHRTILSPRMLQKGIPDLILPNVGRISSHNAGEAKVLVVYHNLDRMKLLGFDSLWAEMLPSQK
ncbi:hypothetical protein RRF57_005924 [Xylaria bambusicola]|uniref:Uncharacterized protein n=1 Tax=Xylaria bambusicola TaxID=326684 RepID=A0AAN7UR67_9PEZI